MTLIFNNNNTVTVTEGEKKKSRNNTVTRRRREVGCQKLKINTYQSLNNINKNYMEK